MSCCLLLVTLPQLSNTHYHGSIGLRVRAVQDRLLTVMLSCS